MTTHALVKSELFDGFEYILILLMNNLLNLYVVESREDVIQFLAKLIDYLQQ